MDEMCVPPASATPASRSREGKRITFKQNQARDSHTILGDANLIERTEYDAYGQARHHHPLDLDGDDGGGRDGDDIDVFNAASPSDIGDVDYNADCDFDRDGDVDSTDLTVANNLYGTSVIAALPTGYISDPDSAVSTGVESRAGRPCDPGG